MNFNILSAIYFFSLFHTCMFSAEPDKQQNRIIYKDQGGELHQVYNKGTGQNVFMWEPKGEKAELVHDFSGGRKIAPGKFYRMGDELAGMTCSPVGSLTYHLFTRTAEGWRESISTPTGSISVFFNHQEWISTREIRTYDRQGKRMDFVVTDIPLIPNSPDNNAKLILLNGQPYHPRGIDMGGAIWDQPLEKILADHEARLKAAKVKEAQKSVPKSSEKNPSSGKPDAATGKKILLPVSGLDAERGTAFYWAVGGSVAAVLILAFWVKKSGGSRKG